MNEAILAHLKPLYGWESQPEYFAGGHDWSDGTLYRYQREGKTYLLKVMKPGSEHPYPAVRERQHFMEYLNLHGVATTKPLRSCRGELVERMSYEDQEYMVYTWEMVPGTHLELGDPRDCRDYYIAWGRMLGRMHALAKDLPDWQHSACTDAEGVPLISRQREWEIFYNWLQDEDVRKAWTELNAELDALPKKRDNYGFIHNDAHPHNILGDNGKLILIDFDVANYLWFALDIAICVYSEYSRVNFHSGFAHRNSELEELFLLPFMEGYESENILSPEDKATVPIFLRYRRFLMFACFYDQIKKNAPDYLEQFKQEIISHKDYLSPGKCFEVPRG